MKLLTDLESSSWLEKHGFSSHSLRKGQTEAQFRIPADTGKKTALARLLAQFALDLSPCLLRVFDAEVWPSASVSFLLQALRRASGDDRSIDQASGQLFDADDEELLLGSLAVCLYSFWDAFLTDTAGEMSIWLDHDEVMLVRSNNSQMMSEMTQALRSICS